MTSHPQISQLEAALISQAETLAREQQQGTEAMQTRLMAESAERLRLAEVHEVLAAKHEAERLLRLQIQAAETRFSAELDRLRWTLTEATLSAMRAAFEERVKGVSTYQRDLERWLADAAAALPEGDLVCEVRPEDEALLAPVWDTLTSRAAPTRKVVLGVHRHRSVGGMRVRTADNRARIDQTFEARQARLADALAREAMAALFGA